MAHAGIKKNSYIVLPISISLFSELSSTFLTFSYWKRKIYRKLFLLCEVNRIWYAGLVGHPGLGVLEESSPMVLYPRAASWESSGNPLHHVLNIQKSSVTRQLLKLFPSMLQHHRKHNRAIRQVVLQVTAFCPPIFFKVFSLPSCFIPKARCSFTESLLPSDKLLKVQYILLKLIKLPLYQFIASFCLSRVHWNCKLCPTSMGNSRGFSFPYVRICLMFVCFFFHEICG